MNNDTEKLKTIIRLKE